MEPDSSLDLTIEDLPGIGRRYELTGTNGGRITVVITHSGRRIVHGLDPGADQASAVELTDRQARKLGAILGGAFFKPAVVEELEAVFGSLLIDWVTLQDTSPGGRQDHRGAAGPPPDRGDHRGRRPRQPGDHDARAVGGVAGRRPPGHHRPPPGQRPVPRAGGRLSPGRSQGTIG
jgi:hypothetical protein